MDDNVVIGLIVWMAVSSFAAQFASIHMERFLVEHDPSFERPPLSARLFIGRIFGGLSMLGPYAALRQTQGLAPHGVYGFWIGLGSTLLSLGVFLVFLTTL
jgi:hypothetical protein